MKKVLLLTWSVILAYQSYALDDQFSITKEKITITSFSEEEFDSSDYYSSDNPYSQGIEVISSTENTTTIFNGTTYYGSELKFNNLDQGSYYLEISREGYETIGKWITLSSDRRVVVKVQLAREFGHLDISSNVDDFTVQINGYNLDSYYTLPTGRYRIKIRSFGYKDQDFKVTINKSEVTHKDIVLEQVKFDFTGFKIDKERFNPDAKGGFSQNSLKVFVNGPGSGELYIKNSSDNTVITHNIEFSDWTSIIDLSGLIIRNSSLDDGDYSAIISAEGKEISADFVIDRSISYRLLPLHNGSTGLLKTATGEINSTISQTSFGIGSSIEDSDLSIVINHYSVILPFFQLHGGINLDMNFDSEISLFTINAGSMLAFSTNWLSWGLNLNYFLNRSYSQNIDDILTHTVSVNSPFTLNFEPLFFTLSPGYKYSVDNKFYGLGIGGHWDNQQVRVGLSARSDTEDFETYSLEYGGEIYYLLPNTQSYIGINLTGDRDVNINIALLFSVLY